MADKHRKKKMIITLAIKKLLDAYNTKALFFLMTQNDPVISTCTRLLMRRDSVPRIRRYVESVVPRYSLSDFKSHFRLERSSFELICVAIGRHFKRQKGSTPLPVEKQLLIFLWFMGTHDSFRSLADRFGVSTSTAHTCCGNIARKISLHLVKRFIKWPRNEALDSVTQGFLEKCKLPGVVGAIDACHVRITAPQINQESYYNRKKFHSVILQAVSDNRLLFLDIFVGWPGSSHDARVFKNSPLFLEIAENAIPCNKYILGDAAYPLLPWLMTPFKDYGTLSREKQNYNKQHSRGRQVVERAFGQLKGRFRRLTLFYVHKIELLVYCIVAVCVLHNVCILNDDEINDFCEEPDINVYDELNEDRESGILFRDDLVRYLSQ